MAGFFEYLWAAGKPIFSMLLLTGCNVWLFCRIPNKYSIPSLANAWTVMLKGGKSTWAPVMKMQLHRSGSLRKWMWSRRKKTGWPKQMMFNPSSSSFLFLSICSHSLITFEVHCHSHKMVSSFCLFCLCCVSPLLWTAAYCMVWVVIVILFVSMALIAMLLRCQIVWWILSLWHAICAIRIWVS